MEQSPSSQPHDPVSLEGLGTEVDVEGPAGESTWGFGEGTHLAPGYQAWHLLSVGKRFEMWAAWSLDRLTPVCVKMPRRDNFTDSAVNALRREYTATAACDHPAIPRVFELNLDGVVPYLVLEYIEGQPLGSWIDAEGPMDSEGVVYAGLQILAALRHLHTRGFVHHDLKPANIMVRGERPVLVDFDLAVPIGSQRSRTTPRGTREYLSPEQIRCAPASPSMDLFGLGAVLYRTATGVSPFGSGESRTATSDSRDAPGPAHVDLPESEAEQPRRYRQLDGDRRPVAELAPTLAPSVADAIEVLLALDERRRPATAEAAITLLSDAWAEHGEPLWPPYVTATLDRTNRSAGGRSSTRGVPRTEVVTGAGVALDWCASMSPTDRSRTVVVVDRRASEAPPIAELCRVLSTAPAASVIPVESAERGTELVEDLATQLADANAETVVAIGDTAIQDVVRLASVMVADRDPIAKRLVNPDAGGLIRLNLAQPQTVVVSIPTTLATGVEANPTAMVRHDEVTRLVLSADLQPAVALLDPAITASTSRHHARNALVEALFRYIGPVMSGPSSVPTADDQALVEVAALTELLRIHRTSELSADQRLEVAIRSANARRGYALDGRDPFGNKLGFLAMTLTDVAPVSRADALLTMFPAVAGRIDEGDTRFGHRDQLLRLAACVADDPGDSDNPAAASATLVDLFGPAASRSGSSAEPAQAAALANRVWGDTQPMLGMFTEDELVAVFAAALAAPGSP